MLSQIESHLRKLIKPFGVSIGGDGCRLTPCENGPGVGWKGTVATSRQDVCSQRDVGQQSDNTFNMQDFIVRFLW